MTTITIVKRKGQVIMAADSLTTWGDTCEDAQTVINHDKIYRYQDNLFGFIGSSSWNLLFQHYLKSLKEQPLFDTPETIFSFCLDFHRALKEDYFINPNDNEDNSFESSQFLFLIANKHGIFGIDSWRSVQEYRNYYAYGSGYKFAVGAMHALWDKIDDPSGIAIAGIEAAARFDRNTGLPYSIEKIDLES